MIPTIFAPLRRAYAKAIRRGALSPTYILLKGITMSNKLVDIQREILDLRNIRKKMMISSLEINDLMSGVRRDLELQASISEIVGIDLPPLLDGETDRALEVLSEMLNRISAKIDAYDSAIAALERELLEVARHHS